jgi:hypothetical protein
MAAMRVPVVILWWLLWSAAGVVVIALPDRGPRLVSLSAAHGPSLLDAVGILLLLAGTAGPWWFIWRRRSRLDAVAAAGRRVLLVASGVGAGLLVASVLGDFTAWWAVGAGILTAVQVAVFAAVAR